MAVKSIGDLYGFVSVNDAIRAEKRQWQEERQKSEATIAKLQEEKAKFVAESAAKDARIKELESLLAKKG